MRKVEKIEEDIENQLSEEIISVRKGRFSWKSVFVLFFVFMVIGYLIGDPGEEEKKLHKPSQKKKKKAATSKPKKKKK